MPSNVTAVTGLAFEARIAAGPGVNVLCATERLRSVEWLEALLPTNVPGSSALESREDWIAVYLPVIGSSPRPWSRTRDNFRPIQVGHGAFWRWYRLRYMPQFRVSTRLWPTRQQNCVSNNRTEQ
jgi:hypothetical protein